MASVSGPLNIIPTNDEDDVFFDKLERNKESDNILLIGRPGAGKSSLVNTVHKALTGEYLEIAEVGKGIAPTVTLELKRYDNCGVKEENIEKTRRKDRTVSSIKKYPNWIDFPGLPNENTKALRQIIELLLGGYLPPKTTISGLQKIQKENGERGLSVHFKTPNPLWKVNKIIVVHGHNGEIPKSLIEALSGVLKMYDPETTQRKYSCRVFLLITKCDLVNGKNEENDLNKAEKELAAELNIEGVLNKRKQRFVNLSDHTRDDKEIVKTTFTFLTKLVESVDQTEEQVFHTLGFKDRIFLKLLKLQRSFDNVLDLEFHQILIFLLIVVVALAFLYQLLIATATDGTSPSSAINTVTSAIAKRNP